MFTFHKEENLDVSSNYFFRISHMHTHLNIPAFYTIHFYKTDLITSHTNMLSNVLDSLLNTLFSFVQQQYSIKLFVNVESTTESFGKTKWQ